MGGLRTILVMILGCFFSSYCAFGFHGGIGTEADPYIITDVNELQAIQHDLSACYALGNDIDASATKIWNEGAGFDPIGWYIDPNKYDAFTGKFDGRGFIIFDLFINRPFTDYVGLFGLILDGAEVKNVGLADADITARLNSGSLVGSSSGATLSDSWSTGIVKGSYYYQMRLGGLIGRSSGENSFVTRCFSNATVIATGGAHQVGGLAGYNGHGSIMSDCYATGDVSGYCKVGGLVGDNIDGSEGTVIQRCYSVGKISNQYWNWGGGLVGFNWRNGITIDSYWDIETSGTIFSWGGIGKSTLEMKQQATFEGWDFVGETVNGLNDIWYMSPEEMMYPKLAWEVKPQAFVVYDFNDNPGWSMEGQWQFGRPQGLGGAAHGHPDPNSGYTGDNVYGVNLSGDYTLTDEGPQYLTTGPIDCSEYSHINLQFARWLNSNEADFVRVFIEVSTDGENWQMVWEHTDTEAAIMDDSWQVVRYPLVSAANYQSDVYIRWGYHILGDEALRFSGWNIDDVQVMGLN